MIKKPDAILFLLDRVDAVHLMVDAHVDGVTLPPGVAEEFNYIVAITVPGHSTLRDAEDFTIDAYGLYIVVPDGNRFRVVLPWKSIYQAVVRNEAQFVWLDDAPKASTVTPPEPDKPLRGGLRAV